MSRVQLRVHGDLNSLAGEIAGAVLKGLPPSLKTGAHGKALALTLRKEFGEKLSQMTTSTEFCGAITWCSEELEALGEGDERLATHGKGVFLLSGPSVLQEMIAALSTLAHRTILRSIEKDEEEVEAIPYSKVVGTVESVLMGHAFDNKLCGNTVVCRENLSS